MESYLPSQMTRWQDKTMNTRMDQDVWDLVGADPVLIKMREVYDGLVFWAETMDQQEMITSLEKLICEYEISLYDKLK